MRAGKENKRQLYVLMALCTVIVVIASFEIHSSFGSKPASYAIARVSSSQTRSTAYGPGLASIRPEPVLRIGQIVRTERVEYSAKGRNIFSVESVPVQIEAPIAPARPAIAVPPPAPEPPKPPAIDIRYLGYTQSTDKIINAILMHGDDSLTARSGDIIFHRYKVGSIQPASVQVTDLSYNRTQTISITDK